MAQRLKAGLYDRPVTELLRHLLEQSPSRHSLGDLDEASAPHLLGRALHDRLVHALGSVTAGSRERKLQRQIELANEVLDLLARAAPQGGAEAGDRFAPPPQRLLAVLEEAPGGPGAGRAPPRPGVPLSTSDLLVNAHHDLRLGTELPLEIASSDRVDLLCSFLKWSGFRLVEEALRKFVLRRPDGLRVLTTAYMGATERRALDALVRLGAQVRVSFDVESTRLHAKAWLFHRESGFSTACIGSSNLSYAAMLDGLEWNVRLSQIDNGPILAKFGAVFQQYWEDPGFEPYDPERDRERWDRTVRRQAIDRNRLLLAIRIEPRPHQAEILDRLVAERDRGHTRNLVVAATGTGKTVVAALDYQRLREQLGPRKSLLFVAHRHEILEQSQAWFRVVLQDPVFGERLGGGELPRAGEHVFANVQSLSEERLAALPAGAFDMVIVDEFHHAAAKTYDRMLRHLQPRFLLGLTATPERADGGSVLHWFDDRIAAELRLWKALDQGLLSPFQYFGVNDDTDLRPLTWTPTGYDPKELRGIYTANDVWVKRVLAEVARRVADPSRMRALGFCVDIEHAEFMADRFTRAGLSSVAVSQRTGARDRADALGRLRSGDVRVVFSVDLFNEGVDLPDVDTVLFCRPTESATVFLQQLGRGLRRTPEKDCLTVLDFIGGAHRKFRHDARLRALLGGTRRQILHDVEAGFPRLPAGCSMQLDEVARQAVIENIRESLGLGQRGLVDDLRGLGRDVDLAAFLRLADADLEDVYPAPGKSWTQLRRRAGLRVPLATPGDGAFEKSLARLLHLDDQPRLEGFLALLRRASPPAGEAVSAGQRMLAALLGERDPARLSPFWRRLWNANAVRGEMIELLQVLADRTGRTWPLAPPLEALPLRVHATYTRDEVIAALDERARSGQLKHSREGVLRSRRWNAEAMFVTLDKSEADFTPTTMYRDYPLSPRRFHWETQPNVHEDTPTARRYIEHARHGLSLLLFVRPASESRPGITAPFCFLGPVRYLRHEGAKPMAIEWALERDMPPGLYQDIKVAAG